MIHITKRVKKGHYTVVITRHAYIRALQRGIDPELVDDSIVNGKMKRFAKNRIKFEKRFKKFSIVCVDEIIENEIIIVTITKKMRK